MVTRRKGESVEDWRERARLSEAARRANPATRERMNETRRRWYHSTGGYERQRAYLERLRTERFFHWRARQWSSRYGVKVTASDLEDLWNAQDGRCALSGRPLGPDAHLDHVTPQALGGAHTIENLRWLDPQVNVCRQHLTDAEFRSLCSDVLLWGAR